MCACACLCVNARKIHESLQHRACPQMGPSARHAVALLVAISLCLPVPVSGALDWELALAASSGNTFKYSASYWTAASITYFGNGNGNTIDAFNVVLVKEVLMNFNNKNASYTLPANISGLFTLQQLANGHSLPALSSHLVTRGSPNGARGIPVNEQPTSGQSSNTWNLVVNATSFAEANEAPGGKFTECQIGFDMRRPNGALNTRVRIGTTADEFKLVNRSCGAPAFTLASAPDTQCIVRWLWWHRPLAESVGSL